MERDKPLLRELGWPKVPLSVEDSTGAGFIVHKQQLSSENITLKILSKRIMKVAKCYEKASYRVHQFLQRLVKQKQLWLLQSGWNMMILPPDGDMWEGKLIFGNPRRRIDKNTDIIKLWVCHHYFLKPCRKVLEWPFIWFLWWWHHYSQIISHS